MADNGVAERVTATARSIPWTILSVVALTIVLVALVATHERTVDEAAEIGSLIRCPVCQGVPISESHAPMARNMMAVLRENLDAGATRQEAIDAVMGAYPGSLFLEPSLTGSTLALWLVPALALLGGAGLALTVRRSRRASDVASERSELEQARAQVRSDLDDLAVQVATGDIQAEAAAHLEAAYRAELAEIDAALAGATQPATPLPRSRRRVVAGAVIVLASLAVVVVAAGAFLVDRPDATSGMAGGLEGNPSDYSNETLAAVIAASADHPRIDGMRLALGERYFEEGDYSAAFPYFLDVASSERATDIEAATALTRLGWMAYDGNGEVDTALGLLEEARRLAPEEAYPRYLEGVVRWCGSDDRSEAIEAFREVLAAGVTDADVRVQVEADLAAAENGESCQR